jgi:hypothetical protein
MRLEMLHDHYILLSKRKNLEFSDTVPLKLRPIPKNDWLGFCDPNQPMRSVTINSNKWDKLSSTTKITLVFHELTHCYCDRSHNYNEEESYEDDADIFLVDSQLLANEPGYFEDGCPTTIMHPFILSDACMENHYDHYIDEMFDGCIPY